MNEAEFVFVRILFEFMFVFVFVFVFVSVAMVSITYYRPGSCMDSWNHPVQKRLVSFTSGVGAQ